MSDELNRGADTINSVDELDLVEELDGTEDVETLKEQLAKEREARKQLTARAKKAEELARAKTKEDPQNFNNKTQFNAMEDERLELRLQGYSKEDVNFIMNNGGTKAIEDSNSYVAIALNTKREQKRAEEASAKTADTSGMSDVERKYTKDQLEAMTKEELAKILPRA